MTPALHQGSWGRLRAVRLSSTTTSTRPCPAIRRCLPAVGEAAGLGELGELVRDRGADVAVVEFELALGAVVLVTGSRRRHRRGAQLGEILGAGLAVLGTLAIGAAHELELAIGAVVLATGSRWGSGSLPAGCHA